MRCPALIGRADVMAAIERAIVEPGQRSSVYVFAGEAGIGKTRLVEEAAALARDRDVRVLLGRATPADGSTPYRPIMEALLDGLRHRPLDGDAGLGPYRAVLARFLPDLGPAPMEATEPAGPIVIAEAALRLMSAWRERLLVVLEDVHWTDADTQASLEYLIDHSESAAGIVIVATVRTGESASVERLIDRVAARAEVFRLDVLSPTEVALMVAACLGADDPPDDVVARIVATSDGLPLLVEDLLEPNAAAVPRRLADLIADRLTRLEPPVREVVELGAVLGPRFTIGQLARANAQDETRVWQALDAAARADLVSVTTSEAEFRHALTRDAVLELIPPPTRRELAGVAAAELEPAIADDDAEAAALVAELWIAANDPLRAAPLLLRAGEQAAKQGALGAAESAFRRGLATNPRDDLGTDLRWQLISVLQRQGRHDQMVAEVDRLVAATEATDPRLAALAHLEAARGLVEAGEWDAVDRRLATVRHHADPEQALQAEIAIVEARALVGRRAPGRLVEAEHLASQAVGLASESGRLDLECEGLLTIALCARSRDLNEAADALTRMLSLTEHPGARRWRLAALNELGTVEMLRDAHPAHLEQALSEATQAGAVALVAAVLVNLAALHAMTARFDVMVEVARESEALAGRLGLKPLEAAALRLRGIAAGYQGATDDMERLFAQATHLAPEDPDGHALAWGLGRGYTALIHEDAEAALHAFDQAAAAGEVARVLDPATGASLLLRAVGGQADQSDVTVAWASTPKGSRWNEMWVWSAEAVVAGRQDPSRAMSLFEHGQLAAGPYPVYRTLALRRVAEAALRDGWGDPIPWLQDASVGASDLGFGQVAAACRDLLHAAGVKTTRLRGADHTLPAGLRRLGITNREAEVLGLVRERLTNREIADRLYISVRTVEKHVASLLLKTQTTDRRALARLDV